MNLNRYLYESIMYLFWREYEVAKECSSVWVDSFTNEIIRKDVYMCGYIALTLIGIPNREPESGQVE